MKLKSKCFDSLTSIRNFNWKSLNLVFMKSPNFSFIVLSLYKSKIFISKLVGSLHLQLPKILILQKKRYVIFGTNQKYSVMFMFWSKLKYFGPSKIRSERPLIFNVVFECPFFRGQSLTAIHKCSPDGEHADGHNRS